MLLAINTIRSRINRHRVRIGLTSRQRRRRMQAKISERVSELTALEDQLNQLISNNASWLADKVLSKMFRAEIEEAKQHFRGRRYRLARKCRSSARATLICIERNLRSHLQYGSHPTIN